MFLDCLRFRMVSNTLSTIFEEIHSDRRVRSPPFQVNFEVVLRPLASSSRVGDFSVVGGHEQLTFQCNQNVQYESELSLFASV